MMKKIKLSNMLIVLILSLGAIIMVGPLLWMISTSLKDKAGVFSCLHNGFQIQFDLMPTSACLN